MTGQDIAVPTRRAQREVERAQRSRIVQNGHVGGRRSAGRDSNVRRIAVASLIWVLAVVSTATLATWAIRSAGAQLGGANTLVLPDASTSPAPPQGQVSDLSDGSIPAAAQPASVASPSASRDLTTTSRSTGTGGRGAGVTTPTAAPATASTSDDGAAVVAQGATTPATTAASTTPTSTTSSHTHAPTPTPTPTPTPSPSASSTASALPSATPSPTASPVTLTRTTVGGEVVATCTGAVVTVTATPDRGWSEVPPVAVGDGMLTGFLRGGRTVSVLVSCVAGSPEFSVSG
jgi:hypothetical protein